MSVLRFQSPCLVNWSRQLRTPTPFLPPLPVSPVVRDHRVTALVHDRCRRRRVRRQLSLRLSESSNEPALCAPCLKPCA